MDSCNLQLKLQFQMNEMADRVVSFNNTLDW